MFAKYEDLFLKLSYILDNPDVFGIDIGSAKSGLGYVLRVHVYDDASMDDLGIEDDSLTPGPEINVIHRGEVRSKKPRSRRNFIRPRAGDTIKGFGCGTLGIHIKVEKGKKWRNGFLSAGHVLAHPNWVSGSSEVVKVFHETTGSDLYSEQEFNHVATLDHSLLPEKITENNISFHLDAAIALYEDGWADRLNLNHIGFANTRTCVNDIFVPNGPGSFLGLEVQKYGFGTKFTWATIDGFGVYKALAHGPEYPIIGYMLKPSKRAIFKSKTREISFDGDSGSLWYTDDGKAVGITSVGESDNDLTDESDSSNEWSIASPVHLIQKHYPFELL